MPEMKILLIAGRSLKQGTGLNLGKDSPEYREAVGTVELNGSDMARLGVQESDTVLLANAFGTAHARCRRADLPEGMGFIAYGPASSALMGTETDASGMPSSKQLDVTVRPAPGGKTDAN